MGDIGGQFNKSKEDLKESYIRVGEMMSFKKDDNMDLDSNFESRVLNYRKQKDKEKKSKDKNENGKDHLDENILNYVGSPRKERKQKKHQHKGDLEAKLPKVMAGMHGYESNAIEEDGGNIDSSKYEKVGAYVHNDGRKDEKKRKK